MNEVTSMSLEQGELFYRTDRDGAEQGPIAQQELEDLVKQGSLAKHTEVRRVGTAVWIRLGRFLNIPDSKLPEQGSPSVPELSSLIDQLLMESESAQTKPPHPKVERWYCRVYGKELGPLEVSLLRMMAEQGQLSQTDRVRREGEAKWILADSIAGLFEGLDTKSAQEWKSAPGVGISPQRFSKFVPKAARPKPPPKEPGPPPVTTIPAAAAASVSEAPEPKPAAVAFSPVETTPAAPAYTRSSSWSARPRPSVPAPSFSSPAAAASRKPAYSPPAPAKRSSSREWSFSLADFAASDSGRLVLGIVAVILVCWIAYALGAFAILKDLFGAVTGQGDRPWTDPGW